MCLLGVVCVCGPCLTPVADAQAVFQAAQGTLENGVLPDSSPAVAFMRARMAADPGSGVDAGPKLIIPTVIDLNHVDTSRPELRPVGGGAGSGAGDSADSVVFEMQQLAEGKKQLKLNGNHDAIVDALRRVEGLVVPDARDRIPSFLKELSTGAAECGVDGLFGLGCWWILGLGCCRWAACVHRCV